MRPGQDALLDDVGIHMYGSTDEGGSFYIKTNTANIDSDSIFHAGDLNWWHWLGDTPETMRMQSAWLGVSLRIRGLVRRCSDVPCRQSFGRRYGVGQY